MAKKPTTGTPAKKGGAPKKPPARKTPAKKPAARKAPAKKKPTRRGTPSGAATKPQPHGGAIGNPPFRPTDEQREKVRNYARVFPLHGEHLIARLMGFSRNTLRTHFADDLELGRAEMLASVGSQMISRAMNADAQSVKGDIDAQKFVLARLGGWTTKVDMGESASTPFGGRVDLSRLSEKDLENYGRLAAIAEGLDPEDVIDDADA